ncbi:MAG: vWA domain-containing protein [Pseudomonadales bacterium]
MRITVIIAFVTAMCACTTSEQNTLTPRPDLSAITPGELQVEIHSPTGEIRSADGETTAEVEGVASNIGGVKYLDMMFVLDRSQSLRKSDPNDYRSVGAIGLIESLSPKSDTQIGVVGFDYESELLQPLTSNRDTVIEALGDIKRSGGTDLAAGIHTALEELERSARPESSRVIMLFTDGQSNRKKAIAATLAAQAKGVTIQTVQLGSNQKGASILEEIALGTGGSFVQVSDPTMLPETFLNLRTTGVDSVMLSVNGSEPIPARLAGGTFSGSVPLEVGENRIVARARSVDDQIQESSVTINVRDASCATLEVAALNDGQPTLSLNERSVEIVVDASRSMWGQMDGQAKMEVAKEILEDASDFLPDDLNLALRAYGNSSHSEKKDCTDSTLLVPFGEENREPIREAISDLQPKGQTPIAYALNQAAEDFDNLESERALVLVTDGIESCGGDPVAVARELRKQDIMIHLIGFGLNNDADQDTDKLQAVADASGGQFLTASNSKELKDALAVTVGTQFRVYQGDSVVAKGALGSDEPILLPEGDYRVQLDSVPPHEVPVSLSPRDEVTLTLEKVAGSVSHSEERDRLEYKSCDVIALKDNARSQEITRAGNSRGSNSAGH